MEKYTKKLSVAIIVKNEERCILRCIRSIISRVDEIIVVDTGSTDKTIELIKGLNDTKIKVYFREWKDDFSDARNYALQQVSSEWVFFIDADEYLDENAVDIKTVLKEIQQEEKNNDVVGCPQIIDYNGNTSVGIGRIFKKNSGLKYYGAVHEELRLDRDGAYCFPQLVNTNIKLHHDGYIMEILKDKRKIERNMQLLERMMYLEPENPRWGYFYLRDGNDFLSLETVERYVRKFILYNSEDAISVDNIKIQQYTYAIFSVYVSKYVLLGESEKEAKRLLKIMEYLNSDGSDRIYWETILEINSMKKKKYTMLKGIMNYRKEHLESQYGAIHSEGKNIDLLIGYLLFENGYIEKAMKYFSLVKDIAEDNILVLECKARMKTMGEILKKEQNYEEVVI